MVYERTGIAPGALTFGKAVPVASVEATGQEAMMAPKSTVLFSTMRDFDACSRLNPARYAATGDALGVYADAAAPRSFPHIKALIEQQPDADHGPATAQTQRWRGKSSASSSWGAPMSTLRKGAACWAVCLWSYLRACLAMMPGAAGANEPLYQAAHSVIQIRCLHEGGEMKAAGFVWPKEGFMVTALYAVVGCHQLTLYSEFIKGRTDDTVIKALLEADLALVRTDDTLGLPPLDHATQLPELRGGFEIWGDPHAAEKMLNRMVQFAGGLKRGITTLELA